MSWASLTGPIRKQEPVEGGFNILDGLRDWRQALAYSKGTRGLAGAGGTDVVVLGTSILSGAGASFIYVDSAVNRLRQLLHTAGAAVPDAQREAGLQQVAAHPAAHNAQADESYSFSHDFLALEAESGVRKT